MRVPLLNFEGGPRVPLLNFKGVPGPGFQGPEVPDHRVLVPLLHHALLKIPLHYANILTGMLVNNMIYHYLL